MRAILYAIVFSCLAAYNVYAQQLSFKDTIAAYNTYRVNTNRTGMKVLGGWGLVNIAAGTAGYFTAPENEWKYFHEMNAIWGVVNTGIAALGLYGVRKEANGKLSFKQSYGHYLADKRLYLINAGLDVVYIGAGIALNEYGRDAKHDADIYSGFGKSVAVQGVFLLLFDNIMYAAHQRYNTRWLRIMSEIRFSGTSLGFIHTF